MLLLYFRAEAVPPAEFNSLRQKVSIMENELSNNCSKLNISENAKRALETKEFVFKFVIAGFEAKEIF
jgi:hypothetical protein